MFSLIVAFCGWSSTNYPDCHTEPLLKFDTLAECQSFLREGPNKRWGEAYILAYCAPTKAK